MLTTSPLVDAAIVEPAACIRVAVPDISAIRRRVSIFGGVLGCGLLISAAAPASRCQANAADPIARGAQIFAQRCSRCHGDHGEGRSAIISIAGPSIRAEHDFGKVMTAVEVGPSHMPSFAYVLSVDDMRAVSHFVVDKIADIPLEQGDLGEGGELFRTHCASCHRTAVRGGAMAFVGVNAPPLYGKSAALVAGAVRWGPGPMPAFPPSVLSDKQLSSLVTYVRYAQAPDSPGGSPLNWYGPVAEGFAAWMIIFALVAIAIWIEKGGRG